MGSYWHSDPRTMPPDDLHPVIKKPNKDIHAATMGQLHAIAAAGYLVIYIWEEDWEAGLSATKLPDQKQGHECPQAALF